ncbi:MAG: hypothetical protein LBC02_00795 [Planctomycetaceae bacterium]|jgi:hypothetical protein|nr:hypothetical protein [Planctomycetaceae bacterium]
MDGNTLSPPIDGSTSEPQPFADTCEFNHFNPAAGSVSKFQSEIREKIVRQILQQRLRTTTKLTCEYELPTDWSKEQPSPPVIGRELAALFAGIILVDAAYIFVTSIISGWFSDGKYLRTKYQIANEISFRQLDAHRNILETDVTENDARQSIQRFKDYVYQWY